MAEQKVDQVSKDRVVLVTGASKGFGLLTANALVKEGYCVYGGARSKPKDDFTFNYVELDVTKEESIDAAIKKIVEEKGKIDVLVNNAGRALPAQSVQNTSLEDYRKVMNVNFFGLIAVTQKVLPILLKNKDKTGQIINVSSCISLVALPFASGYTASKAAIDRVTEALYNELSDTNIGVQIISPGPSNTSFDHEFMLKIKEQDEVYKEVIPRFLKGGMALRNEFNVEPSAVADLIVKMVNKDKDASDFRVYPGPSIKQVEKLNKDFNNNYQQNVQFGAYLEE